MCNMMNLYLINSLAVYFNNSVDKLADMLIELFRKLEFIMKFIKLLTDDVSFVQNLYTCVVVLY
jgi:hypothetical protein